jgi:hypothetical protein
MQNETLIKAIRATFKKGDDLDSAIADVKAAAGRMSEIKFTELAMTLASDKYDVPVKRAESSGKLMWDSKAENYETAKKRVNRLVAELFPKAKSEDIEIPAELLKAAAVLAKLASEYEGSRSLASKALAAAFAK